MKSASAAFILLLVLVSTALYSQSETQDIKKYAAYGTKGIIELYGGLSISGTSEESSILNFSADPGFNFFVIDNLYCGARTLVGLTRVSITINSRFYSRKSSETVTNLGLGIPLGYTLKIYNGIFINLAAEFLFYGYNLEQFRFYPNIVTSFKFIVNNAVINFGIKHSFIYFSNDKNQKITDPFYSYGISLGFSAFIDTSRKK
jgi:hypothetical protein